MIIEETFKLIDQDIYKIPIDNILLLEIISNNVNYSKLINLEYVTNNITYKIITVMTDEITKKTFALCKELLMENYNE